MWRMSSKESSWIFCTSWEVRKPSKKWMKGTREFRVEAWAIRAMSITSWMLPAQSSAKPVVRATITSEWSPKMDRAWQATDRAETWNTVGQSSPAIFSMLGIMSSRPWDAVKVVVRAPVVSAPCTAPAAPASDCISVTLGMVPQMFLRFIALRASATSPITEEGVMG